MAADTRSGSRVDAVQMLAALAASGVWAGADHVAV
jgi:hypothetical protein